MAADEQVWAIRPCLYGGQRRERGEVFALAGLTTDERLVEERYVQRVTDRHSRYGCDACAKVFVAGENYALHLEGAHGLARDEARRRAEAGAARGDAG